jgi:uncharacterized membrane protein
MRKDWLPWAFVLLAVIGSVWSFPHLPDHIMTSTVNHGASASKWLILCMIPAVMVVVAGCTALIPALGLDNKSPRTVEPLKAILNGTLLGLLLVHGLILAYGMGYQIELNVISPLITGVVFIAVGNFIPQVRQKQMPGVEASSWSDNGKNINKSQLFMARVYLVGGILMLISTVVPGGASIPVFIVLLLLTVIVSTGGYYKYFKRG